MLKLQPFQRRFLRSALAPGIRTAVLSLPRGNGKSTLVADLAARTLDPDDPLFVLGSESHIVAASIGQARRSTFKLLREFIESSPRAMEYDISESSFQCAVKHKPTNTRISVLASSGKTSQGLVRCPWLFADEPGSWETTGGQLLHEAIQTAQGKPGTNLRVIYIGTLAPETSGWWHDLVSGGSHGSTHVTALRGRLAQWATARELRRVNPLMWAFPESRAALLEERDQAKADTRRKAAFLSYRLNLPAVDEEVALLTPEEWERVLARPVPSRKAGGRQAEAKRLLGVIGQVFRSEPRSVQCFDLRIVKRVWDWDRAGNLKEAKTLLDLINAEFRYDTQSLLFFPHGCVDAVRFWVEGNEYDGLPIVGLDLGGGRAWSGGGGRVGVWARGSVRGDGWRAGHQDSREARPRAWWHVSAPRGGWHVDPDCRPA